MQTLALVSTAFEHACAPWFSEAVALMHAVTGNVSESLQITSNAVFEIVIFENCFQANRHKKWSPVVILTCISWSTKDIEH